MVTYLLPFIFQLSYELEGLNDRKLFDNILKFCNLVFRDLKRVILIHMNKIIIIRNLIIFFQKKLTGQSSGRLL